MKTLRVKVKPNALEPQSDGTWLARVKAPPVDGKANAELVRLIAEQLGVPRACVEIKSGGASRLKVVLVKA